MKQWILLVIAAGQLAIPAMMIHQRELTLRDGHAYKFRTQPVDPYDAFRGRFVALRLEPNSVATNAVIEHGTTVYVTLAEGPDGFAKFTGVSREPPVERDYLKVRTAWSSGGTVSLLLPFDRFYMEENAAPEAERAYREHSRQGGARDAYVIVRVRDGQGVIENLYVAGQPIAEFARTH
jgi:uncharacterized membrane-anchored protein